MEPGTRNTLSVILSEFDSGIVENTPNESIYALKNLFVRLCDRKIFPPPNQVTGIHIWYFYVKRVQFYHYYLFEVCISVPK